MTGIVNSTGAKSGIIGTTVGGGLTHSSVWRLSAAVASSNAFITTSWEETEAPSPGYTTLGDSMTEASGVFTFPTRGYWFIDFNSEVEDGGQRIWCRVQIHVTVDDDAYVLAASNSQGHNPNYLGVANYVNVGTSYLLNVTSTTDVKVKFHAAAHDSGYNSSNFGGDQNVNYTHATFTKLANT